MSYEPRDYLCHILVEADYLIGQSVGVSCRGVHGQRNAFGERSSEVWRSLERRQRKFLTSLVRDSRGITAAVAVERNAFARAGSAPASRNSSSETSMWRCACTTTGARPSPTACQRGRRSQRIPTRLVACAREQRVWCVYGTPYFDDGSARRGRRSRFAEGSRGGPLRLGPHSQGLARRGIALLYGSPRPVDSPVRVDGQQTRR
jgi:hypothetical protein